MSVGPTPWKAWDVLDVIVCGVSSRMDAPPRLALSTLMCMKVLAKFMAPSSGTAQQRTLSDIIMERIRAKQAGDEGSQDAG